VVKRYRLSRCVAVELTDQQFTFPQTFDLKQWWDRELEAYGKGNIRVVLRAEGDAREDIRSLQLKDNSKLAETADVTYCTLFVDAWKWLVPIVLSYAGSILGRAQQ
jgi:hypothetical protein